MAHSWLHALPPIVLVLGIILISYLTQFCGWHGADVIGILTLVIVSVLGLSQLASKNINDTDED